MPANDLNRVVQQLRNIAFRQEAARLTDRQLVERFVSHRDEAAFAALVRRHASLVWGVCRRVLSNHCDAEDAFQATFLVLARKAASIASRDLLANWLHGVAQRTALKARTALTRRQARERQVPGMPEPKAPQPELWQDWLPLLDQELSRLPDRYRSVVILCDLEGKTRNEAAQLLHLPPGTVGSRLSRGRAMLAKRLTRHGLPVTVASITAALSSQAASACVPVRVVWNTLKAATVIAAGKTAAAGAVSAKVAALTEGVVKAMLISKLKTTMVALVAAVSIVALGSSAVWYAAASTAGTEDGQAANAAAGVQVHDPANTAITGENQQKKGKSVIASAASVVEVWDAYHANAALFDEKYADKRVALSGKVGRVMRPQEWDLVVNEDLKLEKARYYLHLMSITGGSVVFCQFSDKDRKHLASLTQNEPIVVEGQCRVLGISHGTEKGIVTNQRLFLFEAKIIKLEK